ncbi:hypothetical protein OSB04_014446 [Centaurea solstitialis]|uniref:Uncharacterized protein n=1 Tax=Centaurea solstitialis TaxID=347529 RepID=A0AA38WJ65_9ASTR|nr:hypothetical protein OSB04_014446 [Centaurea solstitialis]
MSAIVSAAHRRRRPSPPPRLPGEAAAATVYDARRRLGENTGGRRWRRLRRTVVLGRCGGRGLIGGGLGFRSEKKPLIKSKLAGKTRSDSFGSDYGESTHPMALPAFSAAPFLVMILKIGYVFLFSGFPLIRCIMKNVNNFPIYM